MYALILVCIYAGLSAELLGVTKAYYPFYNLDNMLRNGVLNLTESFFSTLRNYAVNAKPVKETDYPWIARVVHATTKDAPHVCTASCIDSGIFVTAARCLYGLKVDYTSIVYRSEQLRVIAFVFPTKTTKQGFDDIAFIVVKSNQVKNWSTIKTFTYVNRTDNSFNWFKQLDYTYGQINGVVIGYSSKKKEQGHQFDLTELSDIVIGLDLCPDILTHAWKIKQFIVPCYHSCTLDQMMRDNPLCKNYHGVEGGAIIDKIKQELIGIATWGSQSVEYELPVGFAFANSDSFYKDFSCAQKIRNDNGMLVTRGYYQSLCNA